MTASNTELVIITVNYKTPTLSINCIQSVLDQADNLPNFRMYIVDNCSDDGSVAAIQKFIDEKQAASNVVLIAAEKNGGYAYGNNLALRVAIEQEPKPKYVWLLNPDTQLHPGAGTVLIDYLSSHDKIGMVGSRLEDDDGTLQISAFRFHSPISEFTSAMQLGILDRIFKYSLVPMPASDEPHQADWLAGASLMIKMAVVEDIGLMDEAYFLYFEEVDYCVAAGRKGWELWYVPQSRVHHVCGAATGISDLRKQAPRRPQYWFDSRRRFFIKNFGKFRAALSDLGLIAGYSIWRLRRFIQKKPDLDPPKFLFDAIRNSVFLRGFSIK